MNQNGKVVVGNMITRSSQNNNATVKNASCGACNDYGQQGNAKNVLFEAKHGKLSMKHELRNKKLRFLPNEIKIKNVPVADQSRTVEKDVNETVNVSNLSNGQPNPDEIIVTVQASEDDFSSGDEVEMEQVYPVSEDEVMRNEPDARLVVNSGIRAINNHRLPEFEIQENVACNLISGGNQENVNGSIMLNDFLLTGEQHR